MTGNSIQILKTLRALFLTGLIAFAGAAANAEEKRVNVPIDDSPVYGAANAPVTIIEFLDFQ